MSQGKATYPQKGKMTYSPEYKHHGLALSYNGSVQGPFFYTRACVYVHPQPINSYIFRAIVEDIRA